MLKTEQDLNRRWALATGASAGIGRAYAEGLARRGCNLVLIARRRARLEELATALRAARGVDVVVLPLDLSDPRSFDRIRSELSAMNVDVLINNAGFATYGPIADVDANNDRRQVDVNINSTVALCHLLVPEMLRRGEGVVINVSSIASFQPIPVICQGDGTACLP